MTLTELLAVLMIISLLATIAVPVYVARQEDARVRVAQGECREIAMAEDTVAAMHGFYVPFQLLDELPANPNDLGAGDEERIDVHYQPGNIYLINPTIRAEDQDGAAQLRLIQGYADLVANTNPLVRKMVENWSGPFISFQRFWFDNGPTSPYSGPTDPAYQIDDDLFRDFPLDPWGNPYRFYSPIGNIGGNDDWQGDLFRFDDPDTDFSNGRLTDNDDLRFQRYAVVSFGRDGMSDTDPDNPNYNGGNPDQIYNDIYYEFGTDGVSRNFGKF